ncbi:polysaccharide deacetylase [Lutibacter sp. Hel_I_33_5]|uniref:polysaccharide deacetylase family protein n=1 Tax=Lutibacter sp. Hel_I_33_5 TaxID=1566289 RepID=UPI00119CF604|nr:polysaccharide deacetylase family protein [Lutibacter sp. Hel_I_33_5]TVZ54860.1 polysaccharide deacetylase [Lutibacter sp. Hel_I_33_5]
MLIVSNYHYIRESFESKYPSIFGVTPKQFQKQLEQLATYGEFISQEQLVSFRNKKFDKNYILITFDDGLSEQYELAKPILDKLGIPYVFFINTMNYTKKEISLVHKVHLVRSQILSKEIIDFISTSFGIHITEEEKKLAQINYNYDDESSACLKYLLNFKLNYSEQEKVITPIFNNLFEEKELVKKLYFTPDQLKELYKDDVLGSHSHHHVPLGLLDASKINKELLASQMFFQDQFGKEAYSVSYPYGSKEACDKVTEIEKSSGFKLGFSMERAVNSQIEKNPLMISRYDCNDLPSGKFDIFKSTDLFKEGVKSNWYQ